jgi:hypothetical protein
MKQDWIYTILVVFSWFLFMFPLGLLFILWLHIENRCVAGILNLKKNVRYLNFVAILFYHGFYILFM